MHKKECEKGTAIVEATLILPFCIIILIALYYVAIFMCQKANLQANLQNALTYYKNVESDTYVEVESGMSYSTADSTQSAQGSSYGSTSKLFPYRFFTMNNKNGSGSFTNFFQTLCGNMFFDRGDNVKVTYETHNYVIYKTISATVTQEVVPAVSLSMVGVGGLTIEVSGTAVVTDSDDLIRNVDFVVDIISETKLGKTAKEMTTKAVNVYNKFKDAFNINAG